MVMTSNGTLKKDDNGYPVMGGTSSTDNATIINSSFDSSTRRLLVSLGSGNTSTTWGTTGNTKTVTDAACLATSLVVFMWATPPIGFWAVVPAAGSFVITSSDSESSTLAFTYKIIN